MPPLAYLKGSLKDHDKLLGGMIDKPPAPSLCPEFLQPSQLSKLLVHMHASC